MPDDTHDQHQQGTAEAGFRVVDRRLFTSEGELRPEALRQKQAEESAPEKAPPEQAAQRAEQAATAKTDTATAPKPLRSFQLLIDFLARNTAVLLGGYADPRTGQAIVDLEGARELLDMLDALREKTRGNLTPDEDRLLMDVLGSLKFSFVEVSQAASQAMKEKARGQT